MTRSLRVLTWNVYFGGHMFDDRRDALLAELARRRADVVMLQEVTLPLLAALIEQPWIDEYHLSDTDGRSIGRYGVVLLSRRPLADVRWIDMPSQMGRLLLVADIADLTVATIHLESMALGRERRVEQLHRIRAELTGDDVLLAGDMNFGPDDDAENAALDPTLADLWPVLRGADPGYTVDTAVNGMRYQLKDKRTQKRIDRVFLRSETWRARSIELVGTEPIDDLGTWTSDHFGLEVCLERSP